MLNAIKARRASAATLAVAIADGVLVVVAAAGHAGALPNLEVLADLGLISLSLVVYAGASRWLLGRSTAGDRLSLAAGGLIAAIFAVDLAVEYFASLPSAASAIVTGLLVLAALAVASRSGFLVVQRGASVRDGAGCAVAAMLLGIAVLVGLGFAAILGFPARTATILKPEYLTAVPHRDYAFAATLENALTHLIEAPILALAAGTAAALLARASLRRSRRAARRALRSRG
jgi:hypothetical protein